MVVPLLPANLLTSLFCTVPIFVSDLGLDISLFSRRVQRLHAAVAVVVSCGLSLALSIFHCTLLRQQHGTFRSPAQRRTRQWVWIVLGACVVGANLAFLIPALIYATQGNGNATASTSLALNEVLPQVLMVSINLAKLHALAKARARRYLRGRVWASWTNMCLLSEKGHKNT